MVIDFGGRATTKMVVGPTTILGAAHYDFGGRYHDFGADCGESLFLGAFGRGTFSRYLDIEGR